MSFGKLIKKRKVTICTILVILLLGAIGSGFYSYQKKLNAVTTELNDIKYEILDESVLSEELLKKWIEENKKTAGVYQTSNDKYTFILISGGEKDTTGYGIALNGVEGTKKEIKIKYQVITPDNADLSTKEKSHPSMVLRYEKDNRTAVDEITEDKK